MTNIFSENIPWSVGIIIVLFGIIATHRLVSFRDKKRVLDSAHSELVAAFTPTLARLDSAIRHIGDLDVPDVNNFIKESFEAHSAAVEKCSRIITSKRNRKALEKAWNEYCKLEPEKGMATLFAGHYAPADKYLEFIKERVENILQS